MSALVIEANGEFVTRCDKRNLFAPEREIYRPYAAGCTLRLDGRRLGPGICTCPGRHLLRGARPPHRHDRGLDACGAGAVRGPDGRPLAEAGADRPELITADLDPRVLRAVRASEPMLSDVRDPTTHPRTRHRLR
ncbi:hypothetical protein [Streptomyces sp. NPDC049590]|uniref:hypothetical protein n=1 Tax=Streptomyces sp. NPDC049590 TaxID=3154834 RepID=UPI0034142373